VSRNLYSGKRFRNAVRAFVLGRAAQGIAYFLLTLWVVRLLRPSDYGAYMALWGLVEMMAPLSSLGLLESVRRYLPDLASRGSTAAVRAFVRWTTLARTLILIAWAGAIAVCWEAIARWLGFDAAQAGGGWVVVLLIVTVLGFRYACEMLEGLLEQRWSQLAHALMPLGRLAGVALLVTAGGVSLAHVLWVDVAVSLGCFLLAEVFLARRFAELESSGTYAVGVREVVGFAWHMAGANVLQAVASAGALRLLVARVLGLDAAGLFAFLQQLVQIVSRYMPAQLLANIIRPMLISRHAAGEADIVSRSVALMWKSNMLIVLAGVAALAVVGDALIGLASGGRFAGAGGVMLVMFVGLGASSQGQLVNMAMQIHDQARALRTQSLLFLLVPAAAVAGAAWGLAGMAAGIVAAQWLRNSFALWWMRRHGVHIHLDWVGAARVALLALVAGGLGVMLAPSAGPWVAVALTLALTVVGAWRIKPLSASEGELIGRVLKGKARFARPFVASR
jgi:O-antigen/teichoic acid export membrane protein